MHDPILTYPSGIVAVEHPCANFFWEEELRRDGPDLRRLESSSTGSQFQRCSADIKRDPKDPTSLFHRGQFYMIMDRVQDALSDFGKAQTLDPTREEYFAASAAANNILGRWQDALDDSTKALGLGSTSPSVYGSRGYAFAILGSLEDAGRALDTAIQLTEKDAYAYSNRACIRLAQGDEDGAEADIRRSGSLPAALVNRAVLGLIRSNFRDAEQACSFLRINDCTYIPILVYRTITCLAQNNAEGANAALLQMMRVASPNADLHPVKTGLPPKGCCAIIPRIPSRRRALALSGPCDLLAYVLHSAGPVNDLMGAILADSGTAHRAGTQDRMKLRLRRFDQATPSRIQAQLFAGDTCISTFRRGQQVLSVLGAFFHEASLLARENPKAEAVTLTSRRLREYLPARGDRRRASKYFVKFTDWWKRGRNAADTKDVFQLFGVRQPKGRWIRGSLLEHIIDLAPANLETDLAPFDLGLRSPRPKRSDSEISDDSR